MKTNLNLPIRVLFALFASASLSLSAEPESNAKLGPGDYNRPLTVGGLSRNYLVHVPPKYDASKPTPVVLLLHGAAANGHVTIQFTGMNEKADQAGFIAVYPNGTGAGEILLTWNAGGMPDTFSKKRPDDVAYIRAVLDDLTKVLNVDPLRIHAAGMSNGGMMCYKLANELSDRIASIAAVSGTMTFSDPKPTRPIAVIHFHGTADTIVPFEGGNGRPRGMELKSVAETIRAWCAVDGCPNEPVVKEEPDSANDGTSVARKIYGPGKNGTEVELVEIKGGGHTWPGKKMKIEFLGKTTLNISANDVIWDFFQKHPMPKSK